MKTTIDIADQILEQAKTLAAERHTTLRTVVEEAMRDYLEAQKRPRRKVALQTHTFGGSGLQAGLSWDDWSTIRSLSYESHGG